MEPKPFYVRIDGNSQTKVPGSSRYNELIRIKMLPTVDEEPPG